MNWGRSIIVLAGCIVIFGAMVWSIIGKENTLAQGHTILLKIAPVDPRSLMQGDYMAIAYDASLFPDQKIVETLPYKGFVILAFDEKGIASFTRIDDGRPLGQSEIKIVYRRAATGPRQSGIRYAATSFFFQEGQAERFESARFVMVAVGSDGSTVITGLADADGQRIPDSSP